MKRLQLLVGLAALLSLGGCLKVSVGATHGGASGGDTDDSVSVSNGVVDISDGDGPEVDVTGAVTTEQRHVQSFHAISVGSIVDLKYTTGAGPSVSVEAQKDVLPHLITTVEDGTLKIDVKGRLHNVKRIIVTVRNPHLDALDVSGAAKAECSGIREDRFSLETSGSSETTVNASAGSLSLDASGASHLHSAGFSGATLKGQMSGSAKAEFDATFGDTELTLDGTAELDLGRLDARRVKLDLSGSSTVEASGRVGDLTVSAGGAGRASLGSLASQNCTASADGGAHVEVNAVRKLNAETSGAGHVGYHGNPQVTKTESGSGSVSAE